jgi:sulfonate transport system substrate-binding protein
MKNSLLKKITFLLALLLLAAGSLSAGGSKEGGAQKLTKIRLGDLPSSNTFIFKVAREKGFFEEEFAKEGIAVELHIFASGPPIVEAFAGGELDFGSIGGQPVVQGFANNIPFKIIASSNWTDSAFSLVAGPKSGIKSIKDVPGKRVAVSFGTNNHQVFVNMLQNGGIPEKDVELVNLPTNEAISALLSGNLDAMLPSEVARKKLVDAGAFIVPDTGSYGKILIVTVATDAFIKTYPNEAARFLKVLRRASDWLKANVEEGLKIGSALNNNASLVDMRVSYESRARSIDLSEENFVTPLRETIDYLFDRNFIKRKITTDEIIDRSVYRNAGLD